MSKPDPFKPRRFSATTLPWVVGAAALVVYAFTLNPWVSLASLDQVARVSGWLLDPELTQPLYFLVTLPLRWMPAAWVPPALNLLNAILAAAVLGLLVLRSRGPQFLILTLSLAQVLWGVAFKWKALTGGDDGLPGIPRPDLGLPVSLSGVTPFYYFSLFLFLVATTLLYLIVRSPFGCTLEGIRENEARMRALGYDVWLHQYIAYLLAGLFAGMAGVLFAYYNGFVSPVDLHLATSAKCLLMVVLGGAGTLFGPALGAAVVVLMENLVSAYTQRWLTILGATYVLVVLFTPEGLWRPIRRGLGRWLPL